jgi:arylsulfatase A-like enzyme
VDLTRRAFLSFAGRLAAGAATGLTACGSDSDAARPNVLFVIVDDLNDWIGCMGHPAAKTPNFDRLAARGVLFSRAYCAAPVCNASRTAIFTGLAPSSTGVYGNRHDWRRTLPGTRTLPHHFGDNGYGVIGSGKIFHQQDRSAWHRFYLRRGDPDPPKRPDNGIGDFGFDWGPIDAPEDDFEDMISVARAQHHLSAAPRARLFLAYGTHRPHTPWYVPPRYLEMYPDEALALPESPADDLDDLPPAARALIREDLHQRIVDAGAWRAAVRAYLAAVSFADAAVGRLLDALAASPRADDTVVVLCSDHGYHLGEKRHWGKATLWERATHAPLIIAAPGLARAGAVCDRVVSYLDIYPTLVELCGLAAPPQLEGRSLVPLLRDPTAAWDSVAVSTWMLRNHSVRTEGWRYTRYADGSEELYDAARDPAEWHNRAADPALAGRKQALARRLPAVDTPASRWIVERRDWSG